MNIDTRSWDSSLTKGLLKSTTHAISAVHQSRLDAIGQQVVLGKGTRAGVFRRVVGSIRRHMKDIIIHSQYEGEGKDLSFNIVYTTPVDGKAGWMFAASKVSFRKPHALVPVGVMPSVISEHAWQRVAAYLKTTTPCLIGTFMFEHSLVLRDNPSASHTATSFGLVFWTDDIERPVAKTFIAADRLEPRNLMLWQKAMEDQK